MAWCSGYLGAFWKSWKYISSHMHKYKNANGKYNTEIQKHKTHMNTYHIRRAYSWSLLVHLLSATRIPANVAQLFSIRA